jgi:hypothetical protein
MWRQEISGHNKEKHMHHSLLRFRNKKTIFIGKSYFFDSMNPTEDMM